jgi:hypothetical protein
MGLLDLLNQVTSGGAAPEQHIDQIAQQAPTDALGRGLADAFRSDQTPSIGEMVARMFSQSNPQQQAGMLNQVLATVGPAVLSGMAGGALARALPPGSTQVTPQQASQLTPGEVQDIVNRAEQQHPGIADALGQFYAQHSGLIKTLGTAALTVALARLRQHVAER